MTNDEAKNIFDAIIKGEGDWAETAEAAATEAISEAPKVDRPLKDNGVSYVEDLVDPTVSKLVSRYAVRAEGVTLFYVDVDLETTADAPAVAKGAPAGTTWHPLTVVSPSGMKRIETLGAAARTMHGDGFHIDGMTVASFILPRAMRFLIQVYNIGA